MACVDYCSVLPSWDFDRDPAEIVQYYFGQEYRFDSSPEEDDPSMNLEVNFNKHLSLQRTPSDSDVREPLTISVTCKPQYRVSICGVHVVSDTRVVELYDTSEGYLKTSQGTQLRGPQDGDGGEETNTVYRCRARLEESQYGLTIKFPKSNDFNSLDIYQIVFILHPELEDDSASIPGQINMSKVKDYVVSMGDNISDGARDLMRSVEDYQKQSGLRSMMAGSRQGSGMMGLMSMFSMLNRSDQSNSSLHNSNPSHSQSTSTPSSQMSRLDRLLQASRNQDGATGGGNNEMADGEMYGMLQDICGKVTKIREAEKTAKAKKEVDRTGSEESGEENKPSKEADNQVKETKNITGVDSDMSKQLSDIEQRLQQTVEQQVRDTEDRLKAHIDAKMAQLEQNLCSKIDSIFQALQKNGRPQDNTEAASEDLQNDCDDDT